MQALQLTRRAQAGLKAAAAVAFLGLATRLGQGTPPLSLGTLMISGTIGIFLYLAAFFSRWEQKFLYTNYDHAAHK